MSEETDKKLKSRNRKKVTVGKIFLLIGFIAAVVFFSMGYIYYLGNNIALVQAPLMDAAMEIRTEATTAHLWFEEIISGDQTRSIEEVLEHIDRADWYAKAMLEGGQRAEGKFFPLSDPLMRQKITEVLHRLGEFRSITLQRWQTYEVSGVGTEIDQKYDGIFDDFIRQAGLVETGLQQVIGEEIYNFRMVQIVLIVICLVATVIVGIVLSRLFRKQISYELELQAANQQLNASNQQLRANEQQLKAANQQLKANEQQLKAANQQLIASEQQLKAVNQQLRASEQEARMLAKFPSEDPNPVLRISKNDVVLYCNEPGKTILDAWNCDENKYLNLPERESHFKEIVLSSGKPAAFDIEHRDRTFSVTLAPVVESGYINIYAHDITERKRAQEKLIEYQKKLKTLASQLSVIEERERHRLATDLHDNIGQSLVMSKMKLDSLRESIASDQTIVVLEEVCDYLGDVIGKIRTLTFDLSSPILYELGFETAVAEWLDEEIEKKHGLKTEFKDDGQPKPLGDDIRALLFCNVRELLINIVKHARAQKVKVYIGTLKDRIFVKIEDNGVGFDPAEIVSNSGFGIFSIRERLEQLDGNLEIESKPGHGSSFTMTVPLKTGKKTEGIKS